MNKQKKSLFRLEIFIALALARFSSIQSRRHNPKADEIERLINDTHSVIWKCSDTECPPGFGLSVQCGSRVSIHQSIECIPCVEGVNYSDSSDYSVCKGCKQCSENQEKSGNCTVVHDYTQCLGCKDGFYRDKISDDCHPCSVCCGNNDHVKECENSGLSPEKQCQEPHDHSDCHPAPTKPTGEGGKFWKQTSLKKTGSTTDLSAEEICGISVGVLLTLLALLFVLWKSGHMTHVLRFFCKLPCCHICWSQSNSGRHTIEFDNCKVHDKLLLDVEKGTYAEDGVTEGALEKGTKTRVKYFRQSSWPERKVFETRPHLLRPHSHTGCPENVNKSQRILPDIRHEATITADLESTQQNPVEDSLPNWPRSSSSAVALEELITTNAFAEQPKVLSVPSTDQATSTTGLNSTQIPQVPQDFQEGLMNKKVRDIPIKFYSRICTCLDVKRGAFWDDYRLLGEKIGLNKDQCELLGQNKDPTNVMAQWFDSQRDSCVGKFRGILQEMGRYDAIEVMDEWVCEEWLKHQTRDLMTF